MSQCYYIDLSKNENGDLVWKEKNFASQCVNAGGISMNCIPDSKV